MIASAIVFSHSLQTRLKMTGLFSNRVERAATIYWALQDERENWHQQTRIPK